MMDDCTQCTCMRAVRLAGLHWDVSRSGLAQLVAPCVGQSTALRALSGRLAMCRIGSGGARRAAGCAVPRVKP